MADNGGNHKTTFRLSNGLAEASPRSHVENHLTDHPPTDPAAKPTWSHSDQQLVRVNQARSSGATTKEGWVERNSDC